MWISSFRVILGRLRLSEKFMGNEIKMQDEQVFTVFRHIARYPIPESDAPTVFIVSFKFARGSHNANAIASIVPMLLITGYPGFVAKIYAVNKSNGYWQGMYQWQSKEALEAYKKSFVFRMMNKRAMPDSLKSMELENQDLYGYVKSRLV